ncbi:MAG: glycoside hydrolase family 15 protein, partial [Solirubrobacterales bacterium]
MGWARAALALIAVVAAGTLLVSGGRGADPRTPPALPGLPPPFLGTAVVGDGGLTAAIDAYGDVVDLRARPGGGALIDNPSARQAAGTVPASTGIVPWVSLNGHQARPLWTADSVRQRYRRGSNVVVTTARFGAKRVRIAYAAGDFLACLTEASKGVRISLRSTEPAATQRLRYNDRTARLIVQAAERSDRRWLRRSRPLGPGAPAWAKQTYRRSLLVLKALTDRRTGAVVAGARDGWAYVWPRDAAAAALALDSAGYRREARKVVRFLLRLELGSGARFYRNGEPVPGRGPQGDASGWVSAAARAARRCRGGGGRAHHRRWGPPTPPPPPPP